MAYLKTWIKAPWAEQVQDVAQMPAEVETQRRRKRKTRKPVSKHFLLSMEDD